MSETVFVIGIISGSVLITLLLRSHIDARRRIWPTPRPWSPQSLIFWSLFRTLNGSVMMLIAIGLLDGWRPIPLSVVFLVAGLTCLGLYLLALMELGRDNVYCGRDGLVTVGIYRWSRNPQYATLLPGYLGLALATGSLFAVLLAGLLAPVAIVMIVLEEAWLGEVYGSEYAQYRADVPRFYNLSLLGRVLNRRLVTLRRELLGWLALLEGVAQRLAHRLGQRGGGHFR